MTLLENEPIDEIHFYQYLAEKAEKEMTDFIAIAQGEMQRDIIRLRAKLKRWKKKMKVLEEQAYDYALDHQLDSYLKTLQEA